MKKWLILLVACVIVGSLFGVLIYSLKPANNEGSATEESIDINEVKKAITMYLSSSELKKDSRFIQVSDNMSIYGSWTVVPVTFLDESPNSYDRNYLFILKKNKSALEVIAFNPPGWFEDDDIPDDAPVELKKTVLGEPHGE